MTLWDPVPSKRSPGGTGAGSAGRCGASGAGGPGGFWGMGWLKIMGSALTFGEFTMNSMMIWIDLEGVFLNLGPFKSVPF